MSLFFFIYISDFVVSSYTIIVVVYEIQITDYFSNLELKNRTMN
jgi:hypothetical protein